MPPTVSLLGWFFFSIAYTWLWSHLSSDMMSGTFSSAPTKLPLTSKNPLLTSPKGLRPNNVQCARAVDAGYIRVSAVVVTVTWVILVVLMLRAAPAVFPNASLCRLVVIIVVEASQASWLFGAQSAEHDGAIDRSPRPRRRTVLGRERTNTGALPGGLPVHSR